jgi:hypothetical protein
MSIPHDPQLSALGASIEDLVVRAATLAQVLEADGAGEPAAALYEVERSLQMAARSVDRARRALPG